VDASASWDPTDFRWRWNIDFRFELEEDFGRAVPVPALGRLKRNSLTVVGGDGSAVKPVDGRICRHFRDVPPFAGANSQRPDQGDVNV
jgi:hypothetical protein